jgi:hypothetical protein
MRNAKPIILLVALAAGVISQGEAATQSYSVTLTFGDATSDGAAPGTNAASGPSQSNFLCANGQTPPNFCFSGNFDGSGDKTWTSNGANTIVLNAGTTSIFSQRNLDESNDGANGNNGTSFYNPYDQLVDGFEDYTAAGQPNCADPNITKLGINKNYSCAQFTPALKIFPTPAKGVGPAATATGTLVVDDVAGTLTGTLNVAAYKYRFGDGSPFNAGQDVISGTGSTLSFALTGNFTAGAGSWTITGGQASFADTAGTCNRGDLTGTLCLASAVLGGHQNNLSHLSWNDVKVYDKADSIAGAALLFTLPGVAGGGTRDGSGNISLSGEFRRPSGSTGGGCLLGIAYNPVKQTLSGSNGNFDANLICGTMTVGIFTLTGSALVNNVPVAATDNATTPINVPVVIDVLANDSKLTDTPLTVTITAQGTKGTAAVNGSPGSPGAITVTYTPNASQSGVDTFTYTVTDKDGDNSSAPVSVTIVRPGQVTSTVKGSFGSTGHGCLQLLTVNVGDAENCLYNGGPIVNSPPLPPYPSGESTGPFSQEAYYDSLATPQAFAVTYIATPGDGKIRQAIDGMVTVDNNDTPSPTDDLISFTLTMRSPFGGDVIRQLGSTNTSAEDKYTTMTQVLAPHGVDSATPNASGGFDYVIGSAGFPTRLVFSDPFTVDPSSTNPNGTPGASPCNGQLFGDMECTASFTAIIADPLRWTPWSSPGSGRPGLSRMEGNIGARTVGSVTGYDCIDTGTNNACKISKVSFGPLQKGPNNTPGAGATAEDVGWDDLYLKVSTDSTGKVISMEGYPVQEYQVFATPTWCGSDPLATFNCNSWIGEHFDASGVGAHDDGPVSANAGSSTDIDVLANDQGFDNPVTVSIVTQPLKGSVTVIGSPGPASGIRVRYTASSNSSGADSFVYKVDDGTKNGTAKVTLNISVPAQARDDSATTRLSTPVSIKVLANDSGFGDPATVSISIPPAHGTAVVVGSPGAQSGIAINYTPAPGFTGSDTLSYQVTDGTNTASAHVSITVLSYKANDDQYITLRNNCCSSYLYVLANDTGFSDPVTVTITTPPNKLGYAYVNNSPGPQSGVNIYYNPSFNSNTSDYTERFTYQVSDGTHTDSATVTMRILTFIAQDDTATTNLGNPVTVNVGANDLGFNYPAAIGLYSFALHGNLTVNGSPGSPNSLSITYSPDPGFMGTDIFQYAIDDGVHIGIATVTVNVINDADHDGIDASVDNCLNTSNPDQRDSDGDGYGNACDGDLNNDGNVNFADLALFRQRFATHDPVADFDGNGVVNFADLAAFRSMFGKPPGPSSLHPNCPPTCP